MKKSKIFSVLLSAVTAFSAVSLAGCGGKDDETVKLNVKTPLIRMTTTAEVGKGGKIATSGDFLMLAAQSFARQYTKEKVEISVNMFPAGAEEQFVTDTIGTEDAADVLYDDFFNMVTYVHSGHAIPLDGLLTSEARADLKPGYLEWGQVAVTDPDEGVKGVTYMLPFLGRQNVLMYNKEIFAEYGLSAFTSDQTGEIQTWTVEEWEYVLDTLAAGMAVKSETTGVQYAPTMMYAKDSAGDTHIMTLISTFMTDAVSGEGLVNDDGYFDFTKDTAIEGLRFLQSGVERGWYMPNPQAFTMSDCDRLFHSGQMAFYLFNIGSEVYAGGEEEIAKYGYVNFPSKGAGGATRFVTGFEILDNQDARKLAVAKDFVKYIYETEAWLDVSDGSISASKRVTVAQEERGMLMIDQFTKNIRNVVHFMRGNPNWQGNENSVRNVFYKNISELLSGKVTPETCAARLNEDCNKATAYGWENSKLHGGWRGIHG